ncbi:MAG: TrmH family RNA methyltransferase [Candidatus Paceibacterota bacterium]|jgi:tRNA G18 (ribose-2'-O)-methylase SpoU
MMKKEIIVILDNIRSVYNVGSIFRTADALGVDKIFLCGCTPTPVDRFGRERKDLAKVALGAEKTIKWEHIENIIDLLKDLKKKKVFIVAIEQDKKSVDYKKIKIKYPLAIVMGTEVTGIDKKTLKFTDVIAEIPMVGKKESLNVSVAFGIAGYGIIKE